MAAFFVTFFIIFYNVLEMSAPYTDKYSKTVLQTAFFYSPVLPKLPVPRSVPRSVTKSAMTIGVITSCPISARASFTQPMELIFRTLIRNS